MEHLHLQLKGTSLITRNVFVLCILMLVFSTSSLSSEGDKPISEEEALTHSSHEGEGASSSLSSDLACISEQNLSVSETGVSTITPGMMLSGNFGNPANFVVEIIEPPLYTNEVTCEMVGQTLSVRVSEIDDPSNSCWGYVHVEDKLPPHVPCNAITVPCNIDPNKANTDLFLPGLWDNCTEEDELDIWFSQTIHDLYCDPNFVAYIDRVWHISDEYGNETICNQRINMGRLSLPLVDFPNDVSLDCENPQTDTAYTGQPTVNGEPITNFCELVITYTDQITPLCGNTYAISRNWSIVDWCTGNSLTDVQLITIEDEKAPVITCPSNTTINAGNGDCTATYFIPSFPVQDNCTPTDELNIQVEVDGYDADAQMPIVLELGVHTVEITATDKCGNSSSCSYTVTVEDVLPPILDCHDLTIEIDETGADQIYYAQNLFGEIIIDNCGIDELLIRRIQSHCNNSSDLYFGPSIKLCCNDVGTPVKAQVKVIDNEGNSSVCDLDFIVVDNTPPVVTCPIDRTLSCGTDVSDLSQFGSPHIEENCDYELEEEVENNLNDCGEGTLIRTFTVTDENGNTGTCSQVLDLTSDNPFDEDDIDWPQDVTLTACNPDLDPSNTGVPIIDEGSCTEVGYTYSDQFGPQGEPCLEINRLWSVTDTCSDQTIQYTQHLLILNNADPDLSVLESVATVNDSGLCGAYIDLPPATTTNCNTGVEITNSYNDQGADIQDTFPVGSTEIIFTAVDDCGNSSVDTLTVLVDDTEKPSLVCPPDITTQSDSGQCSAFVSVPLISASDNCFIDSIENNQTNTDSASAVYPVGTTEVTYTAYDSSGNSASCSFTITVLDMEDPVISCAPDITVDTDSSLCTADVNMSDPVFSDNCSVDTIFNDYTDSLNASGVYDLGTTEVTYTVIDSSGNSTTCSFTVTVEDNEQPTISCPGNVEISATTDSCNAFVEIPLPVILENCQIDSVFNDYTQTNNASGIYPVGTTTVTYTIIDNSGNSASCSFTVTVTDIQDPEINCPSNVTVNTDTDSCLAFVGFDIPTAEDNCGIQTVMNDFTGTEDASGLYPVGTTTVTYTVEDVNGNSTTCSFDVTVVDNQDPEITCPADMTVVSDSSMCGAFIDIELPVVNDNCGIDSTINTHTGIENASGTYPVGTTTVLYTIYDESGNTATCSFTVTVIDEIDPELICPEDITVDTDSLQCSASVSLGIPFSSDNCSVDTVFNDYNGTSDASDVYPMGTTTVTYTAIDSFGNSTSCSFTITVEDNMPPTIVCPGDTVLNNQSGSCSAFVSLPLPLVDDNCFVDSVFNDYNGTSNATDTFPVGTTTVTFTVQDSSGNSSTCSFTVTVQDTMSPTITCPADITVSNDSASCSAIVQVAPPIVDDNCGVDSLFNDYNGTSNATDTFPVGTTTVTFTVQDSSGNSSTCSFTVTVLDTLFPSITCPGNITVSNDSAACSAIVQIDPPVLSDNCGVDTVFNDYNGTSNATDTFPVGTTSVTFTVEDPSGNSVTCSFTVTVQDTMTPTISCPANITANTDSAECSAVVSIPVPTIVENCGVDTLFNDYNGTSNATDTFPVGTTIVTFTVQDSSGNSSTCSFTVTVQDSMAPSIQCPGDITVSSDSNACSAFVQIAPPVVSDNCGVDSVFNDYNGTSNATDTFPVGTTPVVFTVMDSSGNVTECTFTVTVIEDILPMINCPEDLTVFTDSGTCEAFVQITPPVVSDNCGVDSVFNDYNGTSNATDTFPLGMTTVNFTVLDTSGNSAGCSFTVTVLDSMAPSIQCPGDVSVSSDSNSCSAFVQIPTPIVNDNCGVDSVFNDYNGTPNATDTFPAGTTTVIFTVQDSSGNSTSCSFTVTVEETISPMISCPGDLTISSDSNSCSALVTLPFPTVIENCSIDSIYNDYTGTTDFTDTFPVGTTTVTYFAVDSSGNSASCSFMVTVVDDIQPEISCPQDLTVASDSGSCEAFVQIPLPIVNDNCGVDSVFNDYNGTSNATDTFPVGTTSVTFTVLDTFGNSMSCSFTVTVQDSMAPSIQCPGDITTASGSGSCEAFVQIAPPVVGDNCGVDSVFNDYNGTSNATDTFPVGTTTVTFTAFDNGGNSMSCEFTVTVTDGNDPSIVCPADTIVGVNTDSCYAQVSIPLPIVSDACGVDTFFNDYTFGPDASGLYPIDTTTVTYTVIDSAGNSSTCSFEVIVEDDQAPSIVCPIDQTVTADPDSCSAFVSIPIPTVMEECALATLNNDFNQSDDASDRYPVGTTTVIFTATDSSGNSASCSFDVTVLDEESPVLSCPADITIGCDSSYSSLDELGMAVATDNCSVASVDQDSTFNVNDCGIGTIERTWIAMDPSGNADTCMQIITVSGDQNGFIDSLDIIWPADTIEVSSCTGISPDSLNSFPFVSPQAGNCNAVSYTYMDSLVTTNAACLGFLREFTVVDSCQFVDSTNQGVWIYEQLILVNDTVPPSIFVPDSIGVELPPGQCDSAFVNVVASGFDDCPGLTITNNSPYSDSSGADASGFYPMCSPVVVTFTATDTCGNTAEDSAIIHVRDTVPPTFSCDKAEFYFDDQLEARVEADSFVISVMDNCTDSADLFYSFSPDPADSIMIFTCDTDPKVRPITVYVIDECGNYDTCNTLLGLKDRFEVCPDTGTLISGLIYNMQQEAMSGIEVNLTSTQEYVSTTTNADGAFRFPDISKGSDLVIEPYYNKSPLNGVSTYDIVLITKHILGLKELDSPDKLIAADANHSGSITAADLVEIRMLILGMIPEYTNNTSWRFVDANVLMDEPLSNEVPESIKIEDIQDDVTDLLFHAIKIGDVNYSAHAVGHVGVEDRSLPEWYGEVEILPTSDDNYLLRFNATTDLAIEGLQGSFQFDQGVLHSIRLIEEEGVIDWLPAHLYETNRAVRYSWNQEKAAHVQAGDVILTLEVGADSEETLRKGIRWKSEYVRGEIYPESSDMMSLRWRWKEKNREEASFVLHQNVPNPFDHVTDIPFYLPEDGDVQLSIYSADGRRIYRETKFLKAGPNQWSIDLKKIDLSGILYYEVQTSKHKAVKKMVKMRK